MSEPMTARLFDNRLSEEWIGFTNLRRVIIASAIVHFSLAAVSGYRAIVRFEFSRPRCRSCRST